MKFRAIVFLKFHELECTKPAELFSLYVIYYIIYIFSSRASRTPPTLPLFLIELITQVDIPHRSLGDSNMELLH